MIKKQSDDPDVAHAAQQAADIIKQVLSQLPVADSYDYGGHDLKIGEYQVCTRCAGSIAEAQQAAEALRLSSEDIADPVVKEHIELAAHLFELEAEIAIVRAEFHNGFDTEEILNTMLGFVYDRKIHDDYEHNHRQKA